MLGWASTYVGLPFEVAGRTKEGCDCWGLVYLVEKEIFHVDVPILRLDYSLAPEELRELASTTYSTLNYPKVEVPEEGNIVFMNLFGQEFPSHVGIYLNDGFVLHSDPLGRGLSRIQRIDVPPIANRIEGIYRAESRRHF